MNLSEVGTPIVAHVLKTVPVPGLEVTIYDDPIGPMFMTMGLAASETDLYSIEWVRIVPMGIKLYIKSKETGETVRTAVFHERVLLETLANLVLDSIGAPA